MLNFDISCFKNSANTDQQASEKPADQELHCFALSFFVFIKIGAVCIYYCLLIFMSLSTIFQLCRDGSSWDEQVLSKDKCVLLKDTTQ